MASFDDTFAAELRALRPTPPQAFTAELDERAAAGFPRRSGRTSSPLSALVTRLRALPPRRLAFSAGATALAAVAAVAVIVAVSEPESDSSLGTRLAPLYGSDSTPAARPHRHGHSGGTLSSGAPKRSEGEGGSGIEYEAAPNASSEASSGLEIPARGSAAAAGSKSSATTGPFASKAGHRDVERSAEMVLGADPDQVADDAAQVFDAVHAADGIVLSSSVTGGAAGDAGARFDLLIPAARLGDALAAFSGIDAVLSRHEATDDITAPTVRIGEQLRDSRATIDGLLVQLAGADSDEERAEVKLELRAERQHNGSLRSRAAKLNRRANLSRVSLRIETGASATDGVSGGGWGIGDALHDAGHILGVAAAITIVGLAIVGPLALIAFFAWLANRARLRRARERALA
jgi:Domain of unknown function (DUF4349)